MNDNVRVSKLNNKGAALVTVIVIISFISILATVILYSSGLNFAMKATDMKTRKNFYDGEQAVEEIKVYLTNLAKKAFTDEYQNVLQEGIVLGAAKKANFQTEFCNKFEELWTAECGVNDVDHAKALLLSKIDSTAYAGKCSISVGNPVLEKNITEGYVALKDFEFTYTDDNNYTTIIKTDFRIYVPLQYWEIEAPEKVNMPGSLSDVEINNIDITNCVRYVNWTKK